MSSFVQKFPQTLRVRPGPVEGASTGEQQTFRGGNDFCIHELNVKKVDNRDESK